LPDIWPFEAKTFALKSSKEYGSPLKSDGSVSQLLPSNSLGLIPGAPVAVFTVHGSALHRSRSAYNWAKASRTSATPELLYSVFSLL